MVQAWCERAQTHMHMHMHMCMCMHMSCAEAPACRLSGASALAGPARASRHIWCGAGAGGMRFAAATSQRLSFRRHEIRLPAKVSRHVVYGLGEQLRLPSNAPKEFQLWLAFDVVVRLKYDDRDPGLSYCPVQLRPFAHPRSDVEQEDDVGLLHKGVERDVGLKGVEVCLIKGLGEVEDFSDPGRRLDTPLVELESVGMLGLCKVMKHASNVAAQINNHLVFEVDELAKNGQPLIRIALSGEIDVADLNGVIPKASVSGVAPVVSSAAQTTTERAQQKRLDLRHLGRRGISSRPRNLVSAARSWMWGRPVTWRRCMAIGRALQGRKANTAIMISAMFMVQEREVVTTSV